MKLVLAINLLLSLSVFSSDEITPLLADLNSESFQVRTKAHHQIKHWLDKKGAPSIALLEQEVDKASSPEVRIRLEDIIAAYRRRTMKMGSLELYYEPHKEGVLIRQTVIGGAGQQAGLREGDIIEKIDGIVIKKLANNKENSLDKFKSMMLEKFQNETVNIEVRRGEKILKMKITLGERNMKKELEQKLLEPMKFEFK